MNSFDLFLKLDSSEESFKSAMKLEEIFKSTTENLNNGSLDGDDILMTVCYALVVYYINAYTEGILYRGEDPADEHTYKTLLDIAEAISRRSEDLDYDVEILTNLAELRIAELNIVKYSYNRKTTTIA